MKVLLFLFSLLLAVSTHAEEKKPWPPEGYDHVVGFCYDYSQDRRGGQIVFPDGTLNKGIIRATTVRFSKEQADRLVKILTTKPEDEQEEVECYDPHHGFVFYDRNWRVVGWFEVCFLCSDSVASSEAAPDFIDYQALEKFAREAGLPVFEDEADYGRLYTQENPPPTADEKKAATREAKAPDSRGDDPFAGE